MGLLNLIDKIDQHKPSEFIAPVMTKHAKLFTLQNDIPYWFITRVETPGWYLLRPNGKRQQWATVVREAKAHEMMQYLAELPSFLVIVLFPVDETTQLVMPFNLSDAEQRGWKNGVPRHMHIVYHNLRHQNVVQARSIGDNLLFDHVSHINSAMSGKESGIAAEIYEERLALIRQREADEERAKFVKTEQGKLETSLEFMGASLEDWTRELDGYIVRWIIDGQIYRMEVDTNLRVKSAGVCLDSTDSWHSLSSIVAVMQDRQKAIDANEHGNY